MLANISKCKEVFVIIRMTLYRSVVVLFNDCTVNTAKDKHEW